MASGLQKLLKAVGTMTIQGADGSKAVWFWVYKNDISRIKSEMSKEEINESEAAKWANIKKELEKTSK